MSEQQKQGILDTATSFWNECEERIQNDKLNEKNKKCIFLKKLFNLKF